MFNYNNIYIIFSSKWLQNNTPIFYTLYIAIHHIRVVITRRRRPGIREGHAHHAIPRRRRDRHPHEQPSPDQPSWRDVLHRVRLESSLQGRRRGRATGRLVLDSCVTPH